MHGPTLFGIGLIGSFLIACNGEPAPDLGATSTTNRAAFAKADDAAVEKVAIQVAPAIGFGESLLFGATVTGLADTAVSWSVLEPNGGTITSDGTYTAPFAPGTFHVVGTAVADPQRSATAAVIVTAPSFITVLIAPASASLEFGQSLVFAATVTGTTDTAVTWSVLEPNGGTITSNGTYTAPSATGTFHVIATSVADPQRWATATVDVLDPGTPIDGILPPDRRVSWEPGIPGGIPKERQVFTTLSSLPTNGTGDASGAINQAIVDAHAAYLSSGKIQEVVLPAGTFRTTSSIAVSRSGVVLRGQGMGVTRLRFDGADAPAMRIGRARWTDYLAARGPFPLARDGLRGSHEIVLANADATRIEVGDILCIDEEDDPSFVRMGDARYEKRQPKMDTNGPPLRKAGLWRSVTSLIRVTGKAVGATETTLTLAEPLRMSFRATRYAQVFHVATEYSEHRPDYDGVHHAGIEELTFTGGVLGTNNVAFCWIQNVEADGNPGTPYPGTYKNPGGITGRNIDLFHAYRCEVRGSYVHHSRTIAQGGGAYLLSLSSYTSESLVEDNIVVFGNKPIVGNMMGGGNVIAYNYVDNARTNHPTWQEGAIDLNHQSFTHTALVEGNWATNLTSDTTHGNAGWHVFHRNYGTGQNSAPIYGPYPYISGNPDASYRRAAGTDGYHREATYVGNVLLTGPGNQVYQVDQTTPGMGDAAAVWRIGWGVDGDGGTADDGTALALLLRHGNWDSVTGSQQWDPAITQRTIPNSLYLRAKPAFFGAENWPWIDPAGATGGDRVKILPAKQRYEAMQVRIPVPDTIPDPHYHPVDAPIQSVVGGESDLATPVAPVPLRLTLPSGARAGNALLAAVFVNDSTAGQTALPGATPDGWELVASRWSRDYAWGLLYRRIATGGETTFETALTSPYPFAWAGVLWEDSRYTGALRAAAVDRTEGPAPSSPTIDVEPGDLLVGFHFRMAYFDQPILTHGPEWTFVGSAPNSASRRMFVQTAIAAGNRATSVVTSTVDTGWTSAGIAAFAPRAQSETP